MTALPKRYSAVRERRTIPTDVNVKLDVASISVVCGIGQGESFNSSNTQLGYCFQAKDQPRYKSQGEHDNGLFGRSWDGSHNKMVSCFSSHLVVTYDIAL